MTFMLPQAGAHALRLGTCIAGTERPEWHECRIFADRRRRNPL